jgi:hypothetical protein
MRAEDGGIVVSMRSNDTGSCHCQRSRGSQDKRRWLRVKASEYGTKRDATMCVDECPQILLPPLVDCFTDYCVRLYWLCTVGGGGARNLYSIQL